METLALLGTAMGIGFVAGINLYATVLAVGLGLHLGLIQLPPHLAGLSVGDPLVLVVAGLFYTVEFFADKVPWVDSAWDVLHTFIRPLGAAIVGMAAVGHVDPALEVAAALIAGGVALSTHSTKAGLRLLVNASPEPFSNIALSLAEDAVAVAGSWVAIRYPVLAGAATALFLVGFIVLAPRLWRLVRVEILAVSALVRGWLGRGREPCERFDELPAAFAELLPGHFRSEGEMAVRCVSGAGLGAGRHRLGFLCLARGEVCFVTRQGFRVRGYPLDLSRVDEIRCRRGLLLDRVSLRSSLVQVHLYFFKDGDDRLERIVRLLEGARLASPSAA